MEFKDRLKDLRTEKDLLQKELAEKIGVKRTAVSGWECGTREPSISNLVKLANYFGCTIGYLIGVEDNKKTAMPIDIAVNSIENLNIEVLREVYDFLKKNQS